jgi:colanic acid/amylovoran biosynthesis glycosyltransferase
MRKLRIRNHLEFLVKIGRQLGANIVHSHFGQVAWANLGAVRELGAKHVVTFYGLDVNMLPRQPLWRNRYAALFQEADLFLCEGPHMADCLKSLGCPAGKVRVQHLGIPVDQIRFEPRRWRLGDPLRILIAATFRQKKGIPDALEMVGRLQQDQPVEVTIIGGATDEPRSLEEEILIRQILAKYGLDGCVRMLGFQPHSVLWAEAYRHHVFLSPSVTAADGDTEGGAPVSIIEMAASGMPVISTTHCDIPEVLRPEAARFLAPEHNPEALLEIAKSLVRDWPALESPLRVLRTYIETEFDATRQGLRLIEHYQQVLA